MAHKLANVKYTREQVKYISIFIFWKCSGKKKCFCINRSPLRSPDGKPWLSCSCVFSLLTGRLDDWTQSPVTELIWCHLPGLSICLST